MYKVARKSQLGPRVVEPGRNFPAGSGDGDGMGRNGTALKLDVLRSAGALSALALAAFLAGCDGSATVSDPDRVAPALTVTTVQVAQQEINSRVVATGTVVPWQDLSIGTEISGLKVVDVPVEEGDVVKKGQLLAQIDSTVVSAQLRHADAEVKQAEANLEYALADNERAKELVGKGTISPQVADDRKNKAVSAEAQLAMSKAKRDEMLARVVASSVVAPADGIVSKRSVLIGDVVAAGRELFRMVRDGRLELEAEVPETDIALVAEGQQSRITREHIGTITGTVRLVAPTVDPETRLGKVSIALPENSGLKAGMFARAEIMTSRAVVTAVPEAALVWRNDTANVFILTKEDQVELRLVKTGGRQNGWVEIVGGLNGGERVVNTGAGFLNDGDRVEVVTADAVTRPETAKEN